MIGCRGGTLGHYFIYNGRGAVSANSLIVMNTLESNIRPKKKSDECTKEELKRARVRTQVIKLFFQQCARDGYSDQFQCRLAFPTDHPSLDSNVRANPELCNLQESEIDQEIESSDGQSWKSRVDDPTRTKKKKHRHQMRRRKASTKLFRNMPRPRFVFLLVSSKKKMNWRPPALPPIPLPCSKTSCQYQWPLLLRFSSSISSFVLNSMQ